MINKDIARILFEIADMLDMKNVEWKPRAYRGAAKVIESLDEDLKSIYDKGGKDALDDLPKIGKGIAGKIEEYIKTGKIKKYEELKKDIPQKERSFLDIPGMGPKRAKQLKDELGISTIDELMVACKLHEVRNLKGFDEVSEGDIIENIKLMDELKNEIPYDEAKKISDEIIAELKKVKEVKDVSSAGSLRREKSVIRDIDILASAKEHEPVIAHFVSMKNVKKVVNKGDKKATIILKSGVQVDLRVFDPESWGAGLFYFTGNKEYNIRMRKVAIKKGYKLNEYGVYDKDGKLIAGKTEKEICKALDTPYLKPIDRNG